MRWLLIIPLLLGAPSAFALTPPAPGPTCRVRAEVVDAYPFKVGQVDTIRVDVRISEAEQVEAGHLIQPTCESIRDKTLTNVSTWEPFLGQDGSRAYYIPFSTILKVGNIISASMTLYTESNGGLRDIVVMNNDDTRQVGCTPCECGDSRACFYESLPPAMQTVLRIVVALALWSALFAVIIGIPVVIVRWFLKRKD